MRLSTARRATAAVAIAFMAASYAAAQNFPTRPIRLIVPYPPGGNIDISARVISPGMGEALGQTIVVDNRAGAGGNIGANVAAKAPADGYTLLMGSSGPLSINPIITKDVAYDSLRDFAPISTVQVVPLVVIAGPKSSVTTIQELIARLKANPGKITIASAGAGTTNHLAIELFGAMTGTRPLHVPYKGAGPALVDLLGGQVEAKFDQLTASMGYIKEGRVKLLAVTGKRRSPSFPNMPTLDEAGLKGYEASTYIGVLAPSGVPNNVVTRLNDAVRKVMASQEVSDRFRTLGAEPGSSSPEDFRKIIADELTKWREVVRKANLKFD